MPFSTYTRRSDSDKGKRRNCITERLHTHTCFKHLCSIVSDHLLKYVFHSTVNVCPRPTCTDTGSMRLVSIDAFAFIRRESLIHSGKRVDRRTKVLEFRDDEDTEYAIFSHRSSLLSLISAELSRAVKLTSSIYALCSQLLHSDVLREIAGVPHTPQQVGFSHISSHLHLLSYLTSGSSHPFAVPLFRHSTLLHAFPTRTLPFQRRALGWTKDSWKRSHNITCHGHPDLTRRHLGNVCNGMDRLELVERVPKVDNGK